MRIHSLFFALLCIATAGCEHPSAARSIGGDAGKKARASVDTTRIVSVGSAVTEVVFALAKHGAPWC